MVAFNMTSLCAKIVLLAALVSSLFAQTSAGRPHILGLAHVAFRVSDLGRTSAFYERSLGFAEPLSLSEESGQAAIALVKINDDQYIELLPGDARSQGQLDHFAVYTDDLGAMREYLLAQRVPIIRDIHQGRVGNPFLTVSDPDGHPMEIVQYSPTSLTGQSKGKSMPADRVSSHIAHVGILVRSVGSAMRFYREVLGFQELSRGGGGPGHPDWIDLRAPDGSDYIQLLPFSGIPSPADFKAQNHLGLASSDVRKTVASLQTRGTSALNSRVTVQTGGDLPPRADILDPDGARIEIMESAPSGKLTTGASRP
jgi:catechol 2,3-dioxygenase-like lactoylglutathione lyase family enzyme